MTSRRTVGATHHEPWCNPERQTVDGPTFSIEAAAVIREARRERRPFPTLRYGNGSYQGESSPWVSSVWRSGAPTPVSGILVLLLGTSALLRTPTDVFPAIN